MQTDYLENMTEIPVKPLNFYKICCRQDLLLFNEDDLESALGNSRFCSELKVEHRAVQSFHSSKSFHITFHYDRYDPTRAASCILLPVLINNKACDNIQHEDSKCCNIVFCIQCHAREIYEEKNSD